MDLREAKATSTLLHALAGDRPLDPVTAAAVLETLSFAAGTTLQVGPILTPTARHAAVATATHASTSSGTDPKPDTTGGLA